MRFHSLSDNDLFFPFFLFSFLAFFVLLWPLGSKASTPHVDSLYGSSLPLLTIQLSPLCFLGSYHAPLSASTTISFLDINFLYCELPLHIFALFLYLQFCFAHFASIIFLTSKANILLYPLRSIHPYYEPSWQKARSFTTELSSRNGLLVIVSRTQCNSSSFVSHVFSEALKNGYFELRNLVSGRTSKSYMSKIRLTQMTAKVVIHRDEIARW